jgi:hypothetical protein
MIYRKRKEKSGYSLGFTKGKQFIKVELGKRVWYFAYGMPVFWTVTDIKEYRDWTGPYTIVSHLTRKDRVTVDRFKRHPNYDISFDRMLRLVSQAER